VTQSYARKYNATFEYFFQNENRDNCWHVLLELETIVFDKEKSA